MSVEVVNEVTSQTLNQKYIIEWKIPNLSLKGESIRTPAFAPLYNLKDSFCFELFISQYRKPKQVKSPKLVFINLKLVRIFKNEVPPSLKVKINVKLESYNRVFSKKYATQELRIDEIDTINFSNFCFQAYQWSEPITRENVDVDIIEEEFYLYCQLDIFDDLNVHPVYIKETRSLSNLNNIASMYQSGVLTDVEVCIEGRGLQAHKVVLAAQSPVFLKMLTQDFLESKTNTITIADSSYEIFNCFLKYLYSGEIEDKSYPSVKELYSLAHKYDVENLKIECSEIIASFLTVDLVCDVFEIAYSFDDDSLKKAAKQFAATCIQDLISKKEWKELVSRQPSLGYEVLLNLVPLKRDAKKSAIQVMKIEVS